MVLSQRPETGCNRSNHPSNIWAIEREKPLGCVRPLVQLHAKRFFWIYIREFLTLESF